MSIRIALALILVVSIVGSIPADEPARPQHLTDRQVQGVLAALQDRLTERLALRWCSEVQANNGELFEPIRSRCNAEEPEIRRLTAAALNPFGDKSVPSLIYLLKDPDSETRKAAAVALGRIGEKATAAVPNLITLLKDENWYTRQAAAAALGMIDAKAAESVLNLIALLKDPNSGTQQAAAVALGRIGEKAEIAVHDLIPLLKDPNSGTRQAAAEALGRIGGKAAAAVSNLITLLNEKARDTTPVAAEALGRIGEKAAAAVRDLTHLLNDSNASTRRAAAEALGRIGEKAAAAVPALKTLIKDSNSETRQAAEEALGKIGEAAVHYLIALLKDPDSETRQAAAEALGRIGGTDEAAVSALIALIKDSNSAAKALERIGEKAAAAVPTLIALIKHPSLATLRAAAEAEYGIGAKASAAIPALITLLTDSNAVTRRASAEALGKIDKNGIGVSILITMLSDSNAYNRQIAAEALGRIDKNAVAVPILITMLSNPNADTRRAAAEALGRIGEKAAAAVSKLIALLNDPNAETRRAAAEALGRIGEKAAEAVPTLINLLDDKDWDIALVAVETLGRIGEKAAEAVSKLIALLNDSNTYTRQAAVEALGKIGEKAGAAVPKLSLLLKDRAKNTRKITRLILLHRDQRLGAVPHHEIVMAILEIEQDRDERLELSDWLCRSGIITPFDLSGLLEAAHQRIDERHERLLDAYFCAGESERPLVRWLGGRTGKTVLPPKHEDHALLLRQLTAFLPFTTASPRIRSEVARLMHAIVENTIWSYIDLDELKDAYLQLQAAEMKAEADAFLKHVERLEWWRRWSDRLQATSAVWAGHVGFWVGLIVLYPRYRWVQAVFFWNFWVRNISGLVYVPWVITLVPFFRRRLLEPFKNILIPQGFAHEFQGDSYFAGSRISSTREGHPVTLPATEYLAPPLRGPRVIEAPSGFGKTTLLQWFIQQPGDPRVVLRATECDEGVMKAIQKLLAGIAADEKFLQTLVFAGGLDVIIDGLNEASPETRAQITSFVNSLFRGNYLLTTQPLLGFRVPRAAEVWKLQPLAPDQVAAFLMRQWPRVEATAKGKGMTQEQYDSHVRELVTNNGEPCGSDHLGLSAPLDAALVADLLAQDIKPDLNNLVAQHVSLAFDKFREIAPSQDPGFDRVGTRAIERILENKPTLDLTGMGKELEALVERKLLINQGNEYDFRHDRIRDYFIALSMTDATQALKLRQDPRFTGVFEFLPETLETADANELGEYLKAEAANSSDNRVWEKYKIRWNDPGALIRIWGYVREATQHFQQPRAGQSPNYHAIGERAEVALREHELPNWAGLGGEVESLLATRVLLPGESANDPPRFRTPELEAYFIALFLASPGNLARVKGMIKNTLFTPAIAFLRQMLADSPQLAELDQILEKKPSIPRSRRRKGPEKAGDDAPPEPAAND